MTKKIQKICPRGIPAGAKIDFKADKVESSIKGIANKSSEVVYEFGSKVKRKK